MRSLFYSHLASYRCALCRRRLALCQQREHQMTHSPPPSHAPCHHLQSPLDRRYPPRRIPVLSATPRHQQSFPSRRRRMPDGPPLQTHTKSQIENCLRQLARLPVRIHILHKRTTKIRYYYSLSASVLPWVATQRSSFQVMKRVMRELYS